MAETAANKNAKIQAVTTIAAAIISNDVVLEDLCRKAGVFSDINEVIVSEALCIYELISENV